MSDKKYEWLFVGVVLLQVVTWTLIPYAILPNPPLDVLEGYAWSQSPAWGYLKGPPLFAWLLGLGTALMPGSMLPPLILSQLSIAVTYWAVWRLAKYLLCPRDALAVICLTTLIYYFSYPSPEFNPIILQLAFSAVAGSYFYTALIENRMRDWVIVGIAVGFGLLARYSILLHLVPMAIFAFLHKETRDFMLRPGFFIGAAIGSIIIAPHAYWVLNNDFSPLHYIDRRAGYTEGFERIGQPLRFLGAQFTAVAPALIVLLAAVLPLGRNQDPAVNPLRHGSLSRNYLIATGLVPALAVVVVAILIGRGPRAMWGAPLWVFTPLMAIAMLRDVNMPLYRRRLVGIWTVVFTFPVLAFVFSIMAWPSLPDLKGRNKRAHFPGQELALQITAAWHEAIDNKPLSYVAGNMWIAGSVAYYSPDRPDVFQDAALDQAPWIDVDRLRRCGGIAIWQTAPEQANMAASLSTLAIDMQIQPPLDIPPPRYAAPGTRFTFGWAILPPSDANASDHTYCQRPRRFLKHSRF